MRKRSVLSVNWSMQSSSLSISATSTGSYFSSTLQPRAKFSWARRPASATAFMATASAIAGELYSFSSSVRSSGWRSASGLSSLTIFSDSFTIQSAKGISTMAVSRLNTVWKLAIPPLSTARTQKPAPNIDSFSITVITIRNSTVPMVLKAMCTTPVRLASLDEPIEQTIAVVTQVPRLMPIITG